MATYKTPGVYVEEISTLPPSVAEVSTAIPAFVGYTATHPNDKDGKPVAPIVKRISTMLDYETLFGGAFPSSYKVTAGNDLVIGPGDLPEGAVKFNFLLYYSLSLYFKNGGGGCYVVSVGNYGTTPAKSHFEDGLKALAKEDEPTLILLTDAVNLPADKKNQYADYYDLAQQALDQCNSLGDRFAILDIPATVSVDDFRNAPISNHLMYGAAYYPFVQTSLTYEYDEKLVSVVQKVDNKDTTSTLSAIKASNTALYNQIKTALSQQYIIMPPSAAIAGVYASVDRERGVWKAPANVGLSAVIGPTIKITHDDQEKLNVDPTAGKSINAIRAFTGKGVLVWGARTLAGNDNEWRYVSVRRLFNMIEESTQKATAFAVFEPNDATTWLKVKAMIESYLYGLWQQGALAGPTPDAAYFVNVGLGKSMTPQDVLEGRMIVEIGIAAVRPAEFIILRFTHKMQQA
jgi:phage tail sheath protein FI